VLKSNHIVADLSKIIWTPVYCRSGLGGKKLS
jgi:hypothetical protein